MRGIGSKKGQEMSISTLVLIVLAIIVLVLVVIGFTGGWQNLWDRISNLGGSSNNVQLVVQACQVACQSNTQYDYCSLSRKVTFDTANKGWNNDYTCAELAKSEFKVKAGATWPSSKPQLGLESCQAITCETKVGTCGNNLMESGEECDGNAPTGSSCVECKIVANPTG